MLTPGGFLRLLNWLGGEQKYLEMRRRLAKYFDRRGCHTPDDLADKTLNRVIKWLEDHNKDYDPEPAKICYNTARFVFMEYLRSFKRSEDELGKMPSTPTEEEQAVKETRLACLEKCSQTLLQAQQLSADDLNLIIRYYHGKERVKLENRKALAAERGMSASALTNKAFRIREKLRDCVTKCMSE